MVKMIIMDVDGVIVGHKVGVNFPYPNQKVISVLKQIRQKGIPVVLCTGKYHPAIKPIILQANLNNPHITDSGSLIIDPIANKVIKAFKIEKSLVSQIINACFQNNIYIEAYSEENYFIQNNQVSGMVPRRISILQKQPVIAESLVNEAARHVIIKLLPVAVDEQQKRQITELLKQFTGQVTSIWSIHPSTVPWEYCLITSTKASKAQAAKAVTEQLGISLEDTLGIGDTLGDWEFMQLCGYAAAMEDGSPELINLVGSKGEGKYLVAPSVNDDGILKILDYFLN